MWFLLRLIIVVTSFCFRYFRAHKKVALGKVEQELNGTHYTVWPQKAKRGGVIRTVIEIPFKIKSIFKLSYETPMDRFFKKIGFSQEFQTGDAEFDRSFYIASDNPQLWSVLQSQPQLRDQIAILFKKELVSIESDGSTLRFDFENDHSQDKFKHEECISIFKLFSKQPVGLPHFFSENFTPKILLIEALVWSLASYAITVVFEFTINREQVNLDQARLISTGLNLGAAVAVAFVVIIFLWLRGSSRGHRIIIESALVLGICLPIGGPAIISDINIFFDKSATKTVEADVLQTYVRETRNRRRRSYSYYLESQVTSDWNGIQIPSPMQLNLGTYNELQNVKKVKFKIKNGRLGFPWLYAIQPVP